MKWNRFFALAAGFILAAGHSAALAAEPVCLASIEADTDGALPALKRIPTATERRKPPSCGAVNLREAAAITAICC